MPGLGAERAGSLVRLAQGAAARIRGRSLCARRASLAHRHLAPARGGFLRIAVGQSFLGKVAHGQQGHGAPPGFYLAAYWFTFWPAAGLVLIAAPWACMERHERAIRFCLAWIIPTWIGFELVVTKLPHYVLPVYPAIAILIAMALLAGRRPGTVLATVLAVGAALYLIVQSGILYGLEGKISPAAVTLALAGTLILAGFPPRVDGIPAPCVPASPPEPC